MKKPIAFGVVAILALLLNPAFAIECPKFPEQTKKDWEVKVTAEVAKIGPLKGAELKATTRNVTQDLFAKLPDAGRVYLEQMMFSAYCSTLRDDKTLSETEKSKRLREYIREVRIAITAKKTTKTGGKEPLAKNAPAGEPKNLYSGPPTEKSIVVTSQRQTGGITAQNVTINNTVPLKAQSWNELYEELERVRSRNEGHAFVTRIFWLTREPGASISLGPCPGEKCFEFELGELKPSKGTLVQTINLKGDGFGLKRPPKSKYLVEMNTPFSVKGAALLVGIYDNVLAVEMGLHRDSTFEMFASHANIKFTVIDILSDSLRIKLEVGPPYRSSLPVDFRGLGTHPEKESKENKATSP
jgi:hypothetical protein